MAGIWSWELWVFVDVECCCCGPVWLCWCCCARGWPGNCVSWSPPWLVLSVPGDLPPPAPHTDHWPVTRPTFFSGCCPGKTDQGSGNWMMTGYGMLCSPTIKWRVSHTSSCISWSIDNRVTLLNIQSTALLNHWLSWIISFNENNTIWPVSHILIFFSHWSSV